MVENLFEKEDFLKKLGQLDQLKENQPAIDKNERLYLSVY